jgi:hypothetical protein
MMIADAAEMDQMGRIMIAMKRMPFRFIDSATLSVSVFNICPLINTSLLSPQFVHLFAFAKRLIFLSRNHCRRCWRCSTPRILEQQQQRRRMETGTLSPAKSIGQRLFE